MICVDVANLNGQAVLVPVDADVCVYVLTTPAEFSPWVLSHEHASQIAVSIGLLWGFAFVLRTFVRFIQYTR